MPDEEALTEEYTGLRLPVSTDLVKGNYCDTAFICESWETVWGFLAQPSSS